VLIIGGTALIGPHVLRELSTSGVKELHTITRTGKSYYCEHSHIGDRRDLNSLRQKIKDIKPDVLVDMIPFTQQDASCLVSAISDTYVNVIAISSIDVYSAYASLHKTEQLPLQECPLTESMNLRSAHGPEGKAYDKLSVESIYCSNLENISILRLPAIYGWPDTTRVSHYLDQMLDGCEQIKLERSLANWMFSRCFHKNAAHAIALSVLSGNSGQHTYNVADDKTFTERQWIEKIADICGWTGTIVEVSKVTNSPNWLQHFYVSTVKIRSELKYQEMYSPDEGLVDTIAFHAFQRTGNTYKNTIDRYFPGV